MAAVVIRADARALPLPDASVDLIVTSPPYFGLRDYRDGDASLAGQIGSEATPREYVAALLDCTREWVRVLRPSGSIFVNLGDKYAGSHGQWDGDERPDPHRRRAGKVATSRRGCGVKPKSLLGLPWRYALGCVDDLGLILRAEIIWAKPNGLPESVPDRVRRSHEQVFHFTAQPRYYSAVDEVREPHQPPTSGRNPHGARGDHYRVGSDGLMTNGHGTHPTGVDGHLGFNPLGKLPGSVWEIASQPLTVPACRLVLGGRTVRWFMTWREGHAHMRSLARYGWDGPGRPSLRPEADHFAAFPMELPRRIIAGWSPPGICTRCGEGRRPVAVREGLGVIVKGNRRHVPGYADPNRRPDARRDVVATITGYACDCPQPDAPTRPATVADPFGGTGTTALVADALGRTGLSFDRSADYCRLARWRTTDPGERAKAYQVPKPPPVMDGQDALFAL